MFGPFLSVLLVGGALVMSGLKVLREFERGVVFRLGRLVGGVGPAWSTSFRSSSAWSGSTCAP
jgi:regulator of protease activity HflC (stomatin/prohibitin superfamily)